MKRILGLTVLIASVVAGIFLTHLIDDRVKYSQCNIDENEYHQIISEREENVSLLEEMRFNGNILFWDKKGETFYYSLIEGSSQAFDPSIEIFSKYADVHIAFLEGGEAITKEMIARNQVVQAVVYTQKYYYCYNLACTTLPLMNIDCVEEIGDEYVSMEMTLFDNRTNAINRVIISNGNVRVRGAGTKIYPKKGLRIQLTTDSQGGHTRRNLVSLLGMRQDDDWLLYAGYDDHEKVRNVFSSNLWQYSCASDNERGIDAGMEYRYLELFINGEYWGLYALGYPIDRRQLGFGEDVEREGLYKLNTWIDEWKINYAENGTVSGWEQKGVDEEKKEGWYLLQEYYDNLHLYKDEGEKFYQWIDVDNAIDCYLFFNLVQATDSVSTEIYPSINKAKVYNMYIAVMADEQEGIKCLYIPWDLDRTWGNSIEGGLTTDMQVTMESGYLNRIISSQNPEIWDKIFDKYWELRNSAWSETAINCMIDEYEEDIFDSGAFARDMNRWPGDYFHSNPEVKLDNFRGYVMLRLNELDAYYERMESFCHKSIFIRRSAEHKNFEQCRFIIEINDRELLQDSDYVDLLEYLKVDVAKLSADVRYIVSVPSQNSVEYLEISGEAGETVSTNAGILSLARDSERMYAGERDYSVKLDGIVCYDVSDSEKEGMVVAFVSEEGVAKKLNLWKPY